MDSAYGLTYIVLILFQFSNVYAVKEQRNKYSKATNDAAPPPWLASIKTVSVYVPINFHKNELQWNITPFLWYARYNYFQPT